MDVTEVNQLKACIRRARVILIQPRFGNSETWVKISKREADELVRGFKQGETPEHHEMYSGSFGELRDGVLYLG